MGTINPNPMEEGKETLTHPILHHQPQPQQQPYYGIPYYPNPNPNPNPNQEPPVTYILLPSYFLRRRRRCFRSSSSPSSLLLLSFSLLLLLSLLFFLFPSDPQIQLTRLRLRDVSITTHPTPSITISLDLKIKIRNPDFFSLRYRSLLVSLSYRGKQLGFVDSRGGHLRARGISYVDAELSLDGVEILGDIFYFIEDIVRGAVPIDTVTVIDGSLRLFFLEVPVQGRVSCSMNINPANQTVVRQDCYPE